MSNKISVSDLLNTLTVDIVRGSSDGKVPNIDSGLTGKYLDVLKYVCNYPEYHLYHNDTVPVQRILGQIISDLLGQRSYDVLLEALCDLIDVGLIIGVGNSGYRFLDGSPDLLSSKYLRVKPNPHYLNIWKESLPKTPIPIALISGYSTVTQKTRVYIPAFTAKSLIEAYITQDYHCLECNYGYEIDNLNDLKDVWEKGTGDFQISIPVEKVTINDISGYRISCNPKIFTPKLNQLRTWEALDWLSIDDISDSIPKLFIYKTEGVTQISDYDIYKEMKDSLTRKIKASCYIQDGDTIKLIGIKDWLDHTMKKFEGHEDLINEFLNIWE